MRRLVLLIGILTLALSVGPVMADDADTKNGDQQKAKKIETLDSVDVLVIEGVDVDKAKKEDAEKAASRAKTAYRVGVPASVSINTGSPTSAKVVSSVGSVRGTWEQLDDGTRLWRLKVKSEGAMELSLGFTKFRLPEGATLRLYDADATLAAGPYTAADNQSFEQLWTPAIAGDEVIIELTIASDKLSQLLLVLGTVNHIYKTTVTGEKSGSCNVDVVCSDADGWEDQIRSVGRYLFTTTQGTYVCTGSLINNTNNDGKAYFLTANHCVDSSSVANTVVVTWDFESSTCRTPGTSASGTAISPSGFPSQSGSVLRATYAPSDVTLLELSNDPSTATTPFWSGWDRSGSIASSTVCIHHPSGDAKRFSADFDPMSITLYEPYPYAPWNSSTSHIKISSWDVGTTEGGSSGSGLWDPNGRIIGQLHGGWAACGDDRADFYGRLYTSWTGGGSDSTRLSNWLDPTGAGVTTLNGKGGTASTIIVPQMMLLNMD